MHKPFAEVFPHFAKSPLAVVTYLLDSTPACFATEWVGIVCETPTQLTFALPCGSPTLKQLRLSQQFAINLPDESMLQALPFRRALQTPEDSAALLAELRLETGRRIAAPIIQSCPVKLECVLCDARESVGQVYVSGQVVALHLGGSCYGLEDHINICRLEPFSQRWLTHSADENDPGAEVSSLF